MIANTLKQQLSEQAPFELHAQVEARLRALWKIVRDAETEEEQKESPQSMTNEGRGSARWGGRSLP